MTPAEQARKDVEEWLREDHMIDDTVPLPSSVEALIARLTPVYERAQAAEARPDPIWQCPIPEHGQCAELCFECCLDLVKESVEETQADVARLTEENASLTEENARLRADHNTARCQLGPTERLRIAAQRVFDDYATSAAAWWDLWHALDAFRKEQTADDTHRRTRLLARFCFLARGAIDLLRRHADGDSAYSVLANNLADVVQETEELADAPPTPKEPTT